MTNNHWKVNLAVATAGLLLAIGGTVAISAEVTDTQILEALKPPSAPRTITRALTGSTPPAETTGCTTENAAVRSLRNSAATRSLTSTERTQVTEVVKGKPSIDLEIGFNYNSAMINPRAVQTVNSLGRALSSPEMANCVFVLGGHTDAKGGEEFNQDLSERRAEAVRTFLAEKFNIARDRLVTVGYGKTQIKNKNNPYAAENRRVQIVNTASK